MEVSSNELPFLPDEEGFHDTLYCEKCQAFLQEPCWQHAVVVQDGYSLPLAFASLPDVLTFHYNDQHQNVLQPPENCNLPSVVAQTTIRPQTVFGPFIAPLGIPGEAHSRTFSSADGQGVTFNLENDRWCNWMKLVRTVDHGQHNLRVFIREHKVLFAAVKVILPGEKLTLALYKDDVDRKEFPNDNVDYVAVCVDCAISGTEVTEDASSIKCEDDECGDARVASKSADFPLNLIAGCFSFDGDQLALALDQTDGVSQAKPLPAQSAEQPPSRTVQRDGSPEYPFPSSFGSAASDALSEEAPGKRLKRSSAEKESAGFASGQMPFSRVYSLRGRNVVRAGAACSDGDFSEDNDENFSLAGKSDSSTTDSEYCTEVEDVLEDSTTKKRGRKRRMVDARDTVRPHKIVAVNPVIGKDSVMPDVCSAEVRSYVRTKIRAEDMRRLNAVVKINPFQFSGSRERRAAWTAVWEAYRADNDTSDKRKAQKALLSCKSLQKYVRCQLRNFPNMLDRYNENNANQAEREFIAVMRVMAQRAGKDYADDAHPLAMHKNAVGVATLSAAVDTQNAHSTLRSNRKRPNSRYVSYVYRFVCWECSMHFKDESLLNLHKMQHSGTTPVSLDCPACQRTFTKVSNLFRHVMDHGVKASQIVHFIPTADPSILSFASSTAAPMDVLPLSHDAHETCFMYTCGLAQCGLRFCTETMADLHQLSHNVPDDYQGDVVCSGCNYVAANAEDLLKHVGRHAAQATDRKLCRLCGEFVENMVVHVRTNHKEEYFKYEAGLALSCDQCETRLRTSDHLATHKLWAHKGEQGRLGCLVCAKPFPSTRQLHAHVQKEHTTGLTCVVCQKRYSRYDRLHQHAKTHKEIYICPTCGSVFRSKRSLVQHQPVHQSDYSFRCDLCGKSFKRSTNLSQHKIVVHTDQVRKKRKAQREEMRRKGVVSEYKCPRQRMRYEEFPYKCEECRLGWMLLGNLQQHQRKKHSQGDATVKNGTSHSVSSSDGNT